MDEIKDMKADVKQVKSEVDRIKDQQQQQPEQKPSLQQQVFKSNVSWIFVKS